MPGAEHRSREPGAEPRAPAPRGVRGSTALHGRPGGRVSARILVAQTRPASRGAPSRCRRAGRARQVPSTPGPARDVGACQVVQKRRDEGRRRRSCCRGWSTSAPTDISGRHAITVSKETGPGEPVPVAPSRMADKKNEDLRIQIHPAVVRTSSRTPRSQNKTREFRAQSVGGTLDHRS